MTRPKNDIPPPPKLYGNGRGGKKWMTYWSDDQGRDRSKTFGSGTTPERHAVRRYQHWLDTQWKVKAHVRAPEGPEATFSIRRLAWRFYWHARHTFRKHGQPTTHVPNVLMAMRELRDGVDDPAKPADALDSPAVAAIRDSMVFRDSNGERVARAMKTVNGRLRIIKDAMVWAREKGLISKETLGDVLTVKRLRKGRSEAKPTRKICSAPADAVIAVRDVVPSPVKAIIELLQITGMRPNEPCVMRGCDLQTSVPEAEGLWVYRPNRHKLEHLEGDASERVVFLGKRCQEVLGPFLRPDLTAYLFSPAEAHAERLAKKRADRKKKRWPSHMARYKADPTKHLGDHYTSETLRRAIHYACKKTGAKKWSPNQLRHSVATEMQRHYGLDGSRVVLGHSDVRTTLIYVDADIQKAMQIAREVG